MNPDSDNFLLRSACILQYNFDILALAETHLIDDNVLTVEGYRWFGHNRKHIHRNARSGSGGVGFLIKDTLCDIFDISVLSDSHEGIFWLKMVHKFEQFTLMPCVCYLPPENSSRYFNVNTFYDCLLTDIYAFQNDGMIYVCGDFNSRCGGLDDFIAGVDNIPPRNIIDFTTNFYGELFVDFLINTNMCMLNGRGSSNNFTSVSVKGSSVVDYCIATHDNLCNMIDFEVVLTSQLINTSGDIRVLAPTCIPDHSLLSWNIVSDTSSYYTKDISNEGTSYDRFDLSNVNNYFMNSHSAVLQINNVIQKLEQGFRSQNDIDLVYEDWCNVVKQNMYKDIPFKTIKSGCRNKKRKPGKSWWSENLTNLWSNLCILEGKWLNCSHRNAKLKFKTEYVQARKFFDREVQKAKRFYWYSMQNELLTDCNVDQTKFWKSIGKIGVGNCKSKQIPMKVTLEDGSTSTCVDDVLFKWKNDFSSLFNKDSVSEPVATENSNNIDGVPFNEHISLLEVKKAVDKVKRGKACGVDELPSEVLKNDATILFLHALYNICFENGITPSLWNRCIINPIPKSTTADPTDPMSYRGISLACTTYKIYCNILNDRLSSWVEDNGILADEQNGFRKKRSTSDQISSLVNLVETRKKLKQCTYAAFIDFRKAYDFINRSKLWTRLNDIGISGKMVLAIKSLYSSVASCVRINSFKTDWFNVHCGLRQGCVLSPLLFNLYINDLAVYLKSFDIGINIDNEKVCILLYADDIVLLAKDEYDLQILLNALNDWCCLKDMSINADKSKIVHFRPDSRARCEHIFKCGNEQLSVVDRYTYLGVVLQEHLDFNVTAKMVAQSASRALGLLIAKCKISGGVPYNVFTKLYDTVVWPVIAYGASIWGYKSFPCINAVQNRAMRFYLGVGKYTPNAAVSGEMGWQPPIVRQWKTVSTFWVRISNTNNSRLNKRIALWANEKSASCKNWFYFVKKHFTDIDFAEFCNLYAPISKPHCVECVGKFGMNKYITDWYASINSIHGTTGRGRNKLRTYCKFKHVFEPEEYCKMILPTRHRSAFSKFRCGVAPIRIETGRYENLRLDDRKCPFCNVIEDEHHVLLECAIYNDLRTLLLQKAILADHNFCNMTKRDQFLFLFSNQSVIRLCAKTCFNILQRRYFYLCK